jgi:predicted acylesterase/phospholipase RssA
VIWCGMRARMLFSLVWLPILLVPQFHHAAFGEARAFYDDSDILAVADPIIVGGESFSSRLSASAGGDEPFGLVLSGGSARAFAHLGVLEVLEEEGIRPDFLVGDSMGAIIALLYCAGMAPSDIALLFDAFPANQLFDPELPFFGGFLDAGRAVSLMRSLVGDLDLADLPIPALVVCEDLVSRRQILLAEGDFATLAVAAFALPAVFEPIRFRDMILIDGGATNLVPVDAAFRFSGKVAVATSLYNRKLNYSSPFVVINRTIDIGKTRRSIEGMRARRPLVIRSDVESLSYMKFSRPEELAARGRAAARAALVELRTLEPSRRAPSEALVERRAYYHERVSRLVAADRLGASFPAPTDVLLGADARFLDEAAGGNEVLHGRRWLGPEAQFRAGAMKLSLSALAGLEGKEDRAWGIGFGTSFGKYFFPSRQGSESGLASHLDLGGVLSGSGILGESGSRTELRELAAFASGGIAFQVLRAAILRPELGAELDRDFSEGDDYRRASCGLALELKSGQRLSSGLGGELDVDSERNFGRAVSGSLSWEPASIAALRLFGVYRSLFEGPGVEARAEDPYRSEPLEGLAERRFICGAEMAWIARPLEASFGELAILERPEIGFYADLSGAETVEAAGGMALRLTIGAEMNAGISFMGLAPLSCSAFAGVATDGSGWAMGLRAGRTLK